MPDRTHTVFVLKKKKNLMRLCGIASHHQLWVFSHFEVKWFCSSALLSSLCCVVSSFGVPVGVKRQGAAGGVSLGCLFPPVVCPGTDYHGAVRRVCSVLWSDWSEPLRKVGLSPFFVAANADSEERTGMSSWGGEGWKCFLTIFALVWLKPVTAQLPRAEITWAVPQLQMEI